MSDARKPAANASARTRTGKPASGRFSFEETAAMQERASELKAVSRRKTGEAKREGEADLLAKIAEMEPSDRAMAERIHAVITASAPGLEPRTWYGMPAYARGDKIVCFFQAASKFKTRYATLGFNDAAKLDDGSMWASAFAISKLTAGDEARIAELVKKAVS